MNYCSQNSRYKIHQKNLKPSKNEKQQINQIIHNHQIIDTKNNFITTNPYKSKNNSSIKSLIRRLQACGHTKINYPRIRARNQKNDMFLQGGSINYIQKMTLLQDNKLVIKSPILRRRKTQTNFQLYTKDSRDHQNIVEEVFISKHKINKFNQSNRKNQQKIINYMKTQVQKYTPLISLSKTIQKKMFVDYPLAQSLNLNALNDHNDSKLAKLNKLQEKNALQQCLEFQEVSKAQKRNKLEQIIKTQQKNKFLSLKLMKNQNIAKVQRRNISTRQTTMQSNISQNNFISLSKQQTRNKNPQSLINSNVEFKLHSKQQLHSNMQLKNISKRQPQIAKKQVQNSDPSKPLFYLSHDQLRDLRLTAKNFIVTQYPSNRIITGSYYKQTAEIASLTKIITFYYCLLIIQKYQLDMDKQYLIIDQQIQCTSGTSAQLLEGDKYSFRQICYGLMLPSGNDAALALAKWGGKIIKKQQSQNNLKVFMNEMNAMCMSIGMKSSFFGNPHGLPHQKSGSTVQDVAIVIGQALKIPFFRQVIKTKSYRCWIQNNGITRQVVWQNTHKLLRRKGFIGVKTGVTVTAGPCLSTCYQIDNKIYIIVLLKTSKPSRRFKQTRRILGKILSKLNWNLYNKQIRQILRNDAQLDSDNSQDEQQFNYQRNDAQEMKKRLKIITCEM